MATSKAAAVAPAPAPATAKEGKKSRSKMLIIIGALVLATAGGGGAWFFMGHKAGAPEKSADARPKATPPVFAQMDPFTVNLQAEGGEQFLQTAFTLKVGSQADVDAIKLYLPQVRSRVLLLLSSKRGGDIATVEGKKKLAEEIIAQLTQPFGKGAQPLDVTDVFFTAFVIQ